MAFERDKKMFKTKLWLNKNAFLKKVFQIKKNTLEYTCVAQPFLLLPVSLLRG